MKQNTHGSSHNVGFIATWMLRLSLTTSGNSPSGEFWRNSTFFSWTMASLQTLCSLSWISACIPVFSWLSPELPNTGGMFFLFFFLFLLDTHQNWILKIRQNSRWTFSPDIFHEWQFFYGCKQQYPNYSNGHWITPLSTKIWQHECFIWIHTKSKADKIG